MIIENGTVTKFDNEDYKIIHRTGTITIPEGVTVIGELAKYYDPGLKRINIPEGVTEIGDDAFYNFPGLTEVTLPDSLTKIGANAFGGCALTEVTLPDSVTKIGGRAFYGCPLTEVILPANLAEMHANAFTHCANSAKIYVPKDATIHHELFPSIYEAEIIRYITKDDIIRDKDAEKFLENVINEKDNKAMLKYAKDKIFKKTVFTNVRCFWKNELKKPTDNPEDDLQKASETLTTCFKFFNDAENSAEEQTKEIKQSVKIKEAQKQFDEKIGEERE